MDTNSNTFLYLFSLPASEPDEEKLRDSVIMCYIGISTTKNKPDNPTRPDPTAFLFEED